VCVCVCDLMIFSKVMIDVIEEISDERFPPYRYAYIYLYLCLYILCVCIYRYTYTYTYVYNVLLM